jgi:glyoxylase-like metal-dependent hydrolase (beta-lactamase superfamily II)/rhodanese-related sulfurtransferase
MTIEEIKIEVGTLARWLTDKRHVTILDVRPKAERKEWSIPGSIHADVYDKLKVNDPNALNYLNLDKSNPVVTVCAEGKTSLKAAEILKQQGFDVYSLEGGMKAWNFAWNTSEITLHGVKIIQERRSSKGCLSYILGSEDEAIVIDAALDPQVYLDLATSNGWSINYVTDTHVHADYLSRTRELAKAALAKHILIDSATVEYPFTPLKNGEYVEFGNALLQAVHTPGHTLESTTFRLGDDAVFTGDTLFVDGVGRPDLKADQDEAMKRATLLYQSLHQLLKLNPKTLVLPAHLATAVSFDGKLIAETIEILKGKLDMLRLNEKEFVDYTLSHIPPAPPNFLTIANLNKQGSYEGYSPLELEAGANRCAVA